MRILYLPENSLGVGDFPEMLLDAKVCNLHEGKALNSQSPIKFQSRKLKCENNVLDMFYMQK